MPLLRERNPQRRAAWPAAVLAPFSLCHQAAVQEDRSSSVHVALPDCQGLNTCSWALHFDKCASQLFILKLSCPFRLRKLCKLYFCSNNTFLCRMCENSFSQDYQFASWLFSSLTCQINYLLLASFGVSCWKCPFPAKVQHIQRVSSLFVTRLPLPLSMPGFSPVLCVFFQTETRCVHRALKPHSLSL